MDSNELQIALTLIGIHWFPMVIAALIWPIKHVRFSIVSAITLLVSIVSLLIVLLCLLIFTDLNDRAGAGHPAGWYMIYAIGTLGILPAIVLVVHFMAGRFIGYLVRKCWSKWVISAAD